MKTVRRDRSKIVLEQEDQLKLIAAVVAYRGSGTMIANTPVPHIAGSPG